VSGWRRYRGPKSDARVPRGTKYGSKAQTVDGLWFPSKLQAARYRQLVELQAAGIVSWFIREPRFDLGGGVKYAADFLVVWNLHNHAAGEVVKLAAARVTVEDCKGVETAVFKVKKKLLEARYPFRLKILTRSDVR